tara:strand:- start:1317 stop:1460 length:144 start_codon:yes stop_codon:yes gene_type:complete
LDPGVAKLAARAGSGAHLALASIFGCDLKAKGLAAWILVPGPSGEVD